MTYVSSVGHYFDPTFESGHLKQRQVGVYYIVKVDSRVLPCVVFGDAFVHVGNEFVGHFGVIVENAFVEAAGEQLNAHDAEYEPEDEADEQHIENGWYGAEESVQYDANALES